MMCSLSFEGMCLFLEVLTGRGSDDLSSRQVFGDIEGFSRGSL